MPPERQSRPPKRVNRVKQIVDQVSARRFRDDQVRTEHASEDRVPDYRLEGGAPNGQDPGHEGFRPGQVAGVCAHVGAVGLGNPVQEPQGDALPVQPLAKAAEERDPIAGAGNLDNDDLFFLR